jgi:hypothetical protein
MEVRHGLNGLRYNALYFRSSNAGPLNPDTHHKFEDCAYKPTADCEHSHTNIHPVLVFYVLFLS